MTEITYIQQQIRNCRKYETKYETKSLLTLLKLEMQSQRRNLEYLLDRTKTQYRENRE